VVAGTSIKTGLPPLPSMLTFTVSGNALYFGLFPFRGNPGGTLSGWKEHCSAKVAPASYRHPLVLIVRTTAPKTPSRAPYLTARRHKLPNPRSADFGVLLKASLPPRRVGSSSSFPADIRRRSDQRSQAHGYRHLRRDPRFGIVSGSEPPLDFPCPNLSGL